MEMLENCIDKIYEKADLTDCDRDKEFFTKKRTSWKPF